MDRNIRKAALRAAAKTAIAFSLTGGLTGACAELHHPPASTLDAATSDAASISDAMSIADASTSDSSVTECDGHLASLELIDSPHVWPSPRFKEPDRSDPLTGSCCLEVHERVTRREPSGVSEGIEMACCDAIIYAQGLVSFSPLGCTAWGPPCPPEMSIFA
jgi:hypothetical protein